MTPDQVTCEITWCDYWAGYGPRDARCRCHGPLVCPDAPAITPGDDE